MTTYKSIIAQTNANGELEFVCYPEERPMSSFDPFDEVLAGDLFNYEKALHEWEQSAQVFKAFTRDEERKIQRYVDEAILERSYSKGVDVTDFVEIRSPGVNEGCVFSDNYYAFCKSPSKHSCADCGKPMNEGERKTFTVCEECWDKIHKPPSKEEAALPTWVTDESGPKREPVKPKYAQPFVNEVIQPVTPHTKIGWDVTKDKPVTEPEESQSTMWNDIISVIKLQASDMLSAERAAKILCLQFKITRLPKA